MSEIRFCIEHPADPPVGRWVAPFRVWAHRTRATDDGIIEERTFLSCHGCRSQARSAIARFAGLTPEQLRCYYDIFRQVPA